MLNDLSIISLTISDTRLEAETCAGSFLGLDGGVIGTTTGKSSFLATILSIISLIILFI